MDRNAVGEPVEGGSMGVEANTMKAWMVVASFVALAGMSVGVEAQTEYTSEHFALVDTNRGSKWLNRHFIEEVYACGAFEEIRLDNGTIHQPFRAARACIRMADHLT